MSATSTFDMMRPGSASSITFSPRSASRRTVRSLRPVAFAVSAAKEVLLGFSESGENIALVGQAIEFGYAVV